MIYLNKLTEMVLLKEGGIVLEMILNGLVWHGLGILCAIGAVGLINRLKVILCGISRPKVVTAVIVGALSGIAGLVIFTIYDSTIGFLGERLNFSPAFRLLFYIPFFFIFPFILGFCFDRLLRCYSPPRAILFSSLLVCAVLVGFPIWWQWMGKLLGVLVIFDPVEHVKMLMRNI